MPVLADVRKIVSGTLRTIRLFARGVRATASGTTRTSRWVVRNVRTVRSRGGVGNVGMMRLFDLHAVSCAGDTLVTIGLAGTIFFSSPADEARGRVAGYLLVTMVPFALLAPLVGPTLDRFRHGRRYALAATMLGRAFLAWVIADNLLGFGLYPAAFGVLALSRAYGVARSAAVPQLLPRGLGLSQAGARASVYGTLAGAIVAPVGAAAFWFGPQWPLRVASVLFLAGVFIALALPPRADSDPPESVPRILHLPWRRRPDTGERILSGRLVLATLAGSAGLRALYGFLLLFLAFAIRQEDLPARLFGVPFGPAGALGLVGAALVAGSFLATAVGSGLDIRRPVRLQAVGLGVVAALGIWAVTRFSLGAVLLFCLGTALASGLAKLAVDASIQERLPETVRASAFAHAETLLMLAWVAGGAAGLIPLAGRVGLAVAALAATLAAIRAGIVAWRLREDLLRGRAPTGPGATGRPRPATPGGASGTTSAGPGYRRPQLPAPPPEPPAPPPERPAPPAADGLPVGYHIYRPSPPGSGLGGDTR